VKNPQHGIRRVIEVQADVGEAPHRADNRDHRIGRRELKSKADPVLESAALRLARTSCPTPG
jgi:hypothetical protein